MPEHGVTLDRWCGQVLECGEQFIALGFECLHIRQSNRWRHTVSEVGSLNDFPEKVFEFLGVLAVEWGNDDACHASPHQLERYVKYQFSMPSVASNASSSVIVRSTSSQK